jgi:hypothetical protein
MPAPSASGVGIGSITGVIKKAGIRAAYSLILG